MRLRELDVYLPGRVSEKYLPRLLCQAARLDRLVGIDAQVAERPAGRVLGGLLQEAERAAAAQSGQDDPACPVLADQRGTGAKML